MDNEKRLKEIEVELEIADKYVEELEENEPPYDPDDPKGSWEKYEAHMQPAWGKVNKLRREKRMLMTPELQRDIPDYGDVMTLEDFVAAVKDGWFIDYDGSGEYVKGGKMSGISIYPSDVQNGAVRDDFDTIIWFNR